MDYLRPGQGTNGFGYESYGSQLLPGCCEIVRNVVPLVLQLLADLFGIGAFTVLSTLMVDPYPKRSSSATACNNLMRCLMDAGGTAALKSPKPSLLNAALPFLIHHVTSSTPLQYSLGPIFLGFPMFFVV
jgi:hypothetical protein